MRHHERTSGIVLVLALVLVLGVAAAPAQTVSEVEKGWTGLSFVGGFSSGSSDTGVALGGTFTYELTPRFALEATGKYLDRGRGADAFDVSGNFLMSLVPSTRDLVPYLAVGGGLYRASWDLGHQRFLGPMANQLGPGTISCTGTGASFMPGAGFMAGAGSMPGFGSGFGPEDCPFGELPEFYAQRLGQVVVPASGTLGSRSFTDPTVNFGGGVRFDVSPHVFVRPDFRMLVVAAEGDTYSLGVFTIQFGYRF